MDNSIPIDLNIKEKYLKGLYQNITIHDIPLDTIINYLSDDFFSSEEYDNWLELNKKLVKDKIDLSPIENINYFELLKKLLLNKYNNTYDLKIDTLEDYRKKYIEYSSAIELITDFFKIKKYDVIQNTYIKELKPFTIVKVEDGELVNSIRIKNKEQKDEVFQNNYDVIQNLYNESDKFILNMKKFLIDEYRTLDDGKQREFESIIRVGMEDTFTYFDRDEIPYDFKINQILDKMFTIEDDDLTFLCYLALFKYHNFIRMDYSDAIINEYNVPQLLKRKYYGSLNNNKPSDEISSKFFKISIESLDDFINSHDVLNDRYSII